MKLVVQRAFGLGRRFMKRLSVVRCPSATCKVFAIEGDDWLIDHSLHSETIPWKALRERARIVLGHQKEQADSNLETVLAGAPSEKPQVYLRQGLSSFMRRSG
jgi:hypothetical protein